MNTTEITERGAESSDKQGVLLQKSGEFFSSYVSGAKRLLGSDRSFTTAEDLNNFIAKPFLMLSSNVFDQEGTTTTLDTTEQLISYLSEKDEVEIELGANLIMAYLKSGLDNINEFLEKVTNGEIIF